MGDDQHGGNELSLKKMLNLDKGREFADSSETFSQSEPEELNEYENYKKQKLIYGFKSLREMSRFSLSASKKGFIDVL